ncbi:50S ribosomal protein L11 methyltransferase [Martelella mediterranea]|uniref:Ribosomal protein L11 methyltransferase n=1 Tax=Martelella mediterranea TaxID=293089 RepID=A0A4R3NWI6_9HYPH|nr:50S ribosomal protein L11 methyltransferase [Martelella mediterranea]TCT43168.1 [LSU ribosomal protein L11P]-lysine N-methyltransferase [Martelella mediterranea]
MSQIRLFVTTNETGAGLVLNGLSEMLGEAPYALATMEIDEKANVWEASVYLDESEEDILSGVFAGVLEGLFPDQTPSVEKEVIPEIDWIAKSLEGLKPVRAGRFLVHGSHDGDKVRPGDLAIEIDAGQAFGTGHHGTTMGCLEMIDAVLKSSKPLNALDLGTGTGVLAMAVRKLRHIPVLATDIDPVAVRVARWNARRNDIVGGIDFVTAPGFHHSAFKLYGPFDLIIANILARPLMKLAPGLKNTLAAGGTVILSGILAEQRYKVLAAYNAQGLCHVHTVWRDGWVTLLLKR